MGVMAKPRKVQEPATPYTAKPKKPVEPVRAKTGGAPVRTLDEAEARKLADKIFTERKDLLRRLAQ